MTRGAGWRRRAHAITASTTIPAPKAGENQAAWRSGLHDSGRQGFHKLAAEANRSAGVLARGCGSRLIDRLRDASLAPPGAGWVARSSAWRYTACAVGPCAAAHRRAFRRGRRRGCGRRSGHRAGGSHWPAPGSCIPACRGSPDLGQPVPSASRTASAMPKSASTASPSWSRMFWGFTSRWITPRWCAKSGALRHLAGDGQRVVRPTADPVQLVG